MDPDGLTIFITCVIGIAELFFVQYLGAVTSCDKDMDARTALGFSNTCAGLVVLCAGAGGFFVYQGWQLFANMPLWGIACAAVYAVALVGFFAMGVSKGERAVAALVVFYPLSVLAQYVLGPLLTFIPLLIFKAGNIDANAAITEEDVLNLVDTVEEQDIIDQSQKEMITNIFELDDMQAGDIMTHRTDVIAVEEATSAREVIALSVEKGVSRLPVFKKTLDNVVGVVYVKDLFVLFDDRQQADTAVEKFMRSAMFVPETCRAKDLLIDFKVKRTQIAVVVDEYGGTAGIVTMEDILEEIVGNIQDEFDNEEEQISACENGFICDGSLDLEELFDAFGKKLPENDEEEDFDSVSGLMTNCLGRIPNTDEKIEIEYGGILFTAISVGERRILKVKCTPVTGSAKEE